MLTLSGVSPATLYFSDRPERVVGHMTNEQFVEGWSLGEDNFAADPPNAVLSYIDAGDNRPEDCVVVLSDPKIDTDSIRYSYQLLEGSDAPVIRCVHSVHRPFGAPAVAGLSRGDASSAAAALLNRFGVPSVERRDSQSSLPHRRWRR